MVYSAVLRMRWTTWVRSLPIACGHMISKYMDRKGATALLTSLHVVNRCCTRGESEDYTAEKAHTGSSLAWKPGTDVTRSPTQGYQWLHKKDSCPPKNEKEG